jgi:hypothetical protein
LPERCVFQSACQHAEHEKYALHQNLPLELQAAIPNYMIPCVPIIQEGEVPLAMFVHLWKKYREWVFEPLTYQSIARLVEVFDTGAIERAKHHHEELSVRKAKELITRHVNKYREDLAKRVKS